ncbi:hypothetical protein BJ742DRAFT_792406 [Cladochytrium replicatum]|nr:hypothetical protein BJ742DRAFT_792406 [Cladochytrium replicatum]
MTNRVSTSKGKAGAKKPPPKHQNKFAFTTNKHSFIAQKIAALPTRGLCRKCLDVIAWRKRMNKYKPLTVPKKCVECQGKNITDAYHIICQKCASAKHVCAKCQQPDEIVSTEKPTSEDTNKESQDHERLLSIMSERQKRSYLRKIEKGDEAGAEKIREKALANPRGEDGIDDDDFDDDENDEPVGDGDDFDDDENDEPLGDGEKDEEDEDDDQEDEEDEEEKEDDK